MELPLFDNLPRIWGFWVCGFFLNLSKFIRQVSNAQGLAEIIVSQSIIQQLTRNNNPNPKTLTF